MQIDGNLPCPEARTDARRQDLTCDRLSATKPELVVPPPEFTGDDRDWISPAVCIERPAQSNPQIPKKGKARTANEVLLFLVRPGATFLASDRSVRSDAVRSLRTEAVQS